MRRKRPEHYPWLWVAGLILGTAWFIYYQETKVPEPKVYLIST